MNFHLTEKETRRAVAKRQCRKCGTHLKCRKIKLVNCFTEDGEHVQILEAYCPKCGDCSNVSGLTKWDLLAIKERKRILEAIGLKRIKIDNLWYQPFAAISGMAADAIADYMIIGSHR